MTTAKFPIITVSTLREILINWPDNGSGTPSLVMLGSTHSDLGEAPLAAVAASPLMIDGSAENHLMIHPQRSVLDCGSTEDDADILDIVLAALTYAGSVSIEDYDPYLANALQIRAVNAIMAAKALNRKFRL
jgi:hypothetical protein